MDNYQLIVYPASRFPGYVPLLRNSKEIQTGPIRKNLCLSVAILESIENIDVNLQLVHPLWY